MKTSRWSAPSRRSFLKAAAVTGAGLLWRPPSTGAQAPETAARREPPKLKVTDLKTYVLKSGQTFVEVFTDGGVTGIGECSPMVDGSVFAAVIDKSIRRHVVGANPFDVERIWREAYFAGYKLGTTGIFVNALAGVDIALWDLMGKALGVPCYMLLGGKLRDKVPLYASAMRHHRTPKEEAAHLAQWVERGFKAVKFHPYQDWAFDQGRDDTVAVTRELRAALGPEIPIMVDVNNAYTVERAIQVGRELEKLHCAHFEEPIAQYDYAGYARLTAALEIPIAAGEQEYTHWQHKDLITQGHIAIIQPDVIKAGGFTEMRKIGVIASAFNRPIRCHNTQPTVGTAAHYHFWVSNPMCVYEQEYPAEDHPLRDKTPILTEPLSIKDGFLTMPDRPGIGVELNRTVLKALLA